MLAASFPVIIYKETSSCLFLCLAACCLSLSNKINRLQATSFTHTNTYQCYFNLTQADFVPLWPWRENQGDSLMDAVSFHNVGCDFTALSPYYCLAEGGARSRGESSTRAILTVKMNQTCNKCLEHIFLPQKCEFEGISFHFSWSWGLRAEVKGFKKRN